MIKKIIKYTLIFLFACFIALLIFPFVFKSKIVAAVENAANDNLNAEVKFTDIDISFLKSFPDIYLSIHDLSVYGKDTFANVLLLETKRVNFDMDIMSLFRKDAIPTIDYIGMFQPKLNIQILSDGNANYMITKVDSTNISDQESKFVLSLKKYDFKNGYVIYNDLMTGVFMEIKNLDHEGQGDFTQDVFDLTTKSEADSLTFAYEGMTYLKDCKTTLDAKINIDFPQEKYLLLDNKLKINELDVNGEGFVQFKDDDIILDFKAETPFEDFKNLLSLIPNAYTADFADVKTKGQASLSVVVDGVFNSLKNILPGFDLKLLVQDGYVKYPQLPSTIENLNFDLHTAAKRSDYKDLFINISKFNFTIDKESVNGNLLVENATGDQSLRGVLNGNINLANIKNALPMTDIEKLSGKVKADIRFDTKMSLVEQEKYDQIKFNGSADITDFIYKAKDSPEVSFSKVTSSFEPKELKINTSLIQLGKSDLKLNMNVINPLAYFSTQKGVSADMNFSSNFFDLDEWSATESSNQPSNATIPMTFSAAEQDLINKFKFNLNGTVNKALFGGHEINNLKINGSGSSNILNISNFSGKINKSDFSVNGEVNNAYDYLFNQKVLSGTINFNSNYFDANAFMEPTSTEATSESLGILPIPENINISIQTDVKKLIYTNLVLENATANIAIREKQAEIKDFNTNIFGGKIGFDGLYDVTDSKSPDFAVKLDMSKIKFVDAFNYFETFAKLAPVAKFIEGYFNTTLILNGKLGDNMMPVLSSLDASGLIETLSGSIKAFKPLEDLGKKLNLDKIKSIDLQNTKNWFEIVKGIVDLKPMSKTISGIDMTISGKHGFGQGMNLDLALIIPRELMKSNIATSSVETGISFLEKEASKLGLNINQGPNIHLDVKITGAYNNPSIKITPVNAAGQNMGSSIKSAVDNQAEVIKDSIRGEVKKAEEKLKDTVRTRVNEEIDIARKKAEDAANKALDSIKNAAKTKVINQVDTLTKGILTDSLKQKAKDAIQKNSDQEIDKIKDKLKDYNPFKKGGKG